MQVHKETIDKVPNSLPNRSNIEIEIFGMDGIPAEELREHERQKNGNRSESDDEEPVMKKPKSEGKSNCVFYVRFLYYIYIHPYESRYYLVMIFYYVLLHLSLYFI